MRGLVQIAILGAFAWLNRRSARASTSDTGAPAEVSDRSCRFLCGGPLDADSLGRDFLAALRRPLPDIFGDVGSADCGARAPVYDVNSGAFVGCAQGDVFGGPDTEDLP